jgi:hypothetical protein
VSRLGGFIPAVTSLLLFYFPPCSVGINAAPASRLIPRRYFETDTAGLAAAIRRGQTLLGLSAFTQPIQILADTPAPGFQVNATSVMPAWYDSLWHVVYNTAWLNNATVAEQR